MEARLVHSLKAPDSMEITLSGIVMFVNALQPEKAMLPILVTLSGMLMEARL